MPRSGTRTDAHLGSTLRSVELSPEELTNRFAAFLSTTKSPRTGEGGPSARELQQQHQALLRSRQMKTCRDPAEILLRRLEYAIEDDDPEEVSAVLVDMDTDVWFEHAAQLLVTACAYANRSGVGGAVPRKDTGDSPNGKTSPTSPLVRISTDVIAHLLEYGAEPSEHARLATNNLSTTTTTTTTTGRVSSM